MNAGSIRGAYESPTMQLTFSAQVYRSTVTITPLGSKEEAYSKRGGVIPCDIIPLSDDLRMLQTSQTEIVTHIMHFFEGTDIGARDIVQILSNVRLGSATLPKYFFVMAMLEPTESSFGFVRCHVRVGQDPVSVA